TANQEFAKRSLHRIEKAIGEGPTSQIWPDLKARIPAPTFDRIASFVGVKIKKEPTWNDLRQLFRTYLDQRITIGKIQISTSERYEVTLGEFGRFLSEEQIILLSGVTKPLVDKF